LGEDGDDGRADLVDHLDAAGLGLLDGGEVGGRGAGGPQGGGDHENAAHGGPLNPRRSQSRSALVPKLLFGNARLRNSVSVFQTARNGVSKNRPFPNGSLGMREGNPHSS